MITVLKNYLLFWFILMANDTKQWVYNHKQFYALFLSLFVYICSPCKACSKFLIYFVDFYPFQLVGCLRWTQLWDIYARTNIWQRKLASKGSYIRENSQKCISCGQKKVQFLILSFLAEVYQGKTVRNSCIDLRHFFNMRRTKKKILKTKLFWLQTRSLP